MDVAGIAKPDIEQVRRERRRALDDRAFADAVRVAALDLLEEGAREGARAAPCQGLAKLIEVIEERRATRAQDAVLRHETDLRLRAALARLSGLDSSGEMSRRAPAELREACGFTRVMISSAQGSRWLPDTMRREDHADPEAAEFDQFAHDGNEIPLDRSLLETEMVRNRVAVIVDDAETDPRTYKPLVRVTRSRSYVAAPITTNRRVIGFLHADRHGQDNQVSQGDLESVDRFTAEFSVRFECAVLRERITGQRAGMAEVFHDVTAALSDLETQPMVPPHPTHQADRARKASGGDHATARLTRREEEILTLLISGASNRAIAQELVLSPETVKSHVASILRKSRATNRAEAAARHLSMRGISGSRSAW